MRHIGKEICPRRYRWAIQSRTEGERENKTFKRKRDIEGTDEALRLENCPLDDLVVYELVSGMEYNICGGTRVDAKVNGRNSERIVE